MFSIVISLKLKNPQDHTPCRGVILAVADAGEAAPTLPLCSLLESPQLGGQTPSTLPESCRRMLSVLMSRPERHELHPVTEGSWQVIPQPPQPSDGATLSLPKCPCATEPQMPTRMTCSSPNRIGFLSSPESLPHFTTGASWDQFSNKPLALKSLPQDLLLGDLILRHLSTSGEGNKGISTAKKGGRGKELGI